MSFLKCNPCVFVINKNYMIVVLTEDNGICRLKIGNKFIYENNSGVLYSNKNYHKFVISQSLLDRNKKYSVLFRKTISRESYRSTFEDERVMGFDYCPVNEKESLNVFHFADIHGNFDSALNCVEKLRDIDLFFINGDVNEVNTLDDYYSTFNFLSKISGGSKPVIFTRGNHDTRGKLAENFNDFYPSLNNKNYYTFSIGVIDGVVLDCGEDKIDSHKDYNGVNVFSEYRKKETSFIKRVKLNADKIRIVISHINPAQTTEKNISAFIIEQSKYQKWIKYLENQNIDFMICGHIHTDYILKYNDSENLINHKFPIIVGSKYQGSLLGGTLLKMSKNNIVAKFIYSDNTCSEEFKI